MKKVSSVDSFKVLKQTLKVKETGWSDKTGFPISKFNEANHRTFSLAFPIANEYQPPREVSAKKRVQSPKVKV